MHEKIIKFLQDYWLLFVIFNPILTLVITPIVIALIHKKTISFSSADDIIKLDEYNKKKEIEKKHNKLRLKLYRNCFQKQKKYNGWILWDFNEIGPIENRWFSVINKEGEHLILKFPEHIIVKRYTFDPNDILQNGHYCLKPNFIEIIINNIKNKINHKIIINNIPLLIKYLEEKKSMNINVEINEIFNHFKKIKFYLIGEMINNIYDEGKRRDLTDIITIKQIGTDQVVPYFKEKNN